MKKRDNKIETDSKEIKTQDVCTEFIEDNCDKKDEQDTSLKQENVLENQSTHTENKQSDEQINDLSQIVDDDSFKEKMAKSKEVSKKDNSPRKKLWSFIFVMINVVIVVLILLGMLEGDNYTPISELNLKADWLIGAILCFVAMIVIDQIRFTLLIKKSTKMHRPFLGYKVGALGKYYDAITPLSTGGQPFQAFYLTQRGVKASHAVSIPVAKYVVQQIVFAILSIVVLILAFTSYKHLLPSGLGTDWVMLACWIGFICNFLIVALVILLSVGTFGKKFVLGILKFLHKIKLIKNYDKTYEKILNIVEEYQRTIKFFVKSPLLLIGMVFTSLLYMFVMYSIPFFVYCSFGGVPTYDMWLSTFIVALMIDLAASFIPIPGGSGVAELSFAAMFTSLFAGASFWALLIWRILTFYGFVLQGFLIVLYDAIIGNKRNRAHLMVLRKRYPDYYQNEDVSHLEDKSHIIEEFEDKAQSQNKKSEDVDDKTFIEEENQNFLQEAQKQLIGEQDNMQDIIDDNVQNQNMDKEDK